MELDAGRNFLVILSPSVISSATNPKDFVVVFPGTDITPSSCIDKYLCGLALSLKKDHNQRISCNCVESVDIGGYPACRKECHYCYASGDNVTTSHYPLSLLISGLTDKNELVCDQNTLKSHDYQTKLLFK
ncbi:DUF1848 family protein [Methanorbis rubei]|uniref:Uncharacterized protein n=1 Tax=Methanorbis rubei TaxID=3028300 RepID=A0AAE4SAX1_9EURY|nr:hypothetical protein [Methanocorpusculaceae archaeon Cs1]